MRLYHFSFLSLLTILLCLRCLDDFHDDLDSLTLYVLDVTHSFHSSIFFPFALFFLSLQIFLFDKDCVGIYSWDFLGLWVLLLFFALYCADWLSVLMLKEWFWVLTEKVGAWRQCRRSIKFQIWKWKPKESWLCY